MKVLIVGYGFAGKLHEKAWKEIGADIKIHDIKMDTKFEFEDVDVIDFCDTPKSRVEYLIKLKDAGFRGKIFVEKPPCRPVDYKEYCKLCSKLDITPMHNYLYFVDKHIKHHANKELKVIILRNNPHKSWYTNTELSGGGILLDHAYHWLYIADSLGFKGFKGWVDGYPDYQCTVTGVKRGAKFKLFATWKSPIRLTIVNGMEFEFRTNENMIKSILSVLRGDYNSDDLRLQSLRVMKFIKGVYENVVEWIRE